MLLLALVMTASAGPPWVSTMHERNDRVEEIREALLRADLAAAKKLAAGLDEASDMELPPESQGFHDALRAASRTLAEAADLTTATQALVGVSSACSGCHASVEGGPDGGAASRLPPQTWSEDDHMKLHAWSVEVMWLGLVAPSDEAWMTGANALAAASVPSVTGNPTYEAQERALHELAATAADATRAQRPALYVQALDGCISCHKGRAQP